MSSSSGSESSANEDSDVKPGHRAFHLGLQELGKNEKYADLTVKCGRRSWRVHKAVICPQSQFFDKACDGGFKEAESSVITLDDDPNTIAVLMHYFYHFEYDVENHTSGTAPLVLALRVYAVADKYFVPPLQQMALDDICARVGSEYNTASFSQGIRELYTMSPMHLEALKDEFLDMARRYPDLFLRKDKYPEFQTALETVPQSAMDVAIEFAKVLKSVEDLSWYSCSGGDCHNRGLKFALSQRPAAAWEWFCPCGCETESGEPPEFLEDGDLLDPLEERSD